MGKVRILNETNINWVLWWGVKKQRGAITSEVVRKQLISTRYSEVCLPISEQWAISILLVGNYKNELGLPCPRLYCFILILNGFKLIILGFVHLFIYSLNLELKLYDTSILGSGHLGALKNKENVENLFKNVIKLSKLHKKKLVLIWYELMTF